jgi:ketosteroid isomerase-like protein
LVSRKNVEIVRRMSEIDEIWSSLFTLRDGKIIRFEGFIDRSGALEATELREGERPAGE